MKLKVDCIYEVIRKTTCHSPSGGTINFLIGDRVKILESQLHTSIVRLVSTKSKVENKVKSPLWYFNTDFYMCNAYLDRPVPSREMQSLRNNTIMVNI